MKRLLIALLLVTTACAPKSAGNTTTSEPNVADGVRVEVMTEGIFRVGKRFVDTKYGIVCYSNGSDTSALTCFEVGR